MSENEQGENGVTELTDRVALEIIRTSLIKSILKQVVNEIDPKSASKLTRTLLRKDSELTTTILENFPSLTNAVIAAVNETLKSLQKMPPGTISASIPAGIKDIDAREIGETVNSLAQALNTAHKENPTLLADAFSPFITNLISSTDFGELGEAIEGSSEDILAMVRASNEVLWTNLGKVMSMGVVLPAIINLIVKSLKETLPQIEGAVGDVLPIGDFAPEVVDEMVSGMPLIKDVDAREIGEVINSLLGIMSSLLHTLGILLGKEAPMTRELISQKLRDTLSTIDPEKFAEATVALSEAGEGITNTVTDVLMENPEFMFSVISTTPAVVNSLVRSSNRAISRIAEMPPELLGAMLSETIAGIDTREVSELLNSLIRTINGIHETNPKLLTDPLSRIISGVDSGEARKLGNYLMEDLRILLGQAQE